METKLDMLFKMGVSNNGVFDVIFSFTNMSMGEWRVSSSAPGLNEFGNVEKSLLDSVKPYSRYALTSISDPFEGIYNENYAANYPGAHASDMKHSDSMKTEKGQKMIEANGTNSFSLLKAVPRKMQRDIDHLSQWYDMRRCYDEFLNIESRLGVRYDYFIRLRDDGYLLAPMKPERLEKYKNEKAIAVSGCEEGQESGETMNDIGALVTREAAYEYFNAPLDDYYLFWHNTMSDRRKGEVNNAAKFLHRVYSKRGIKIVADSNIVPVMSSISLRSSDGGEKDSRDACLVMRYKARKNGGVQCYVDVLKIEREGFEFLLCSPKERADTAHELSDRRLKKKHRRRA